MQLKSLLFGFDRERGVSDFLTHGFRPHAYQRIGFPHFFETGTVSREFCTTTMSNAYSCMPLIHISDMADFNDIARKTLSEKLSDLPGKYIENIKSPQYFFGL
jgi:hypothetical protein